MENQFTLNPVPRDVKPPYLSTFIDEQNYAASFDLVLSTTEYYGLTSADARQIVQETVTAVSGWRKVAAKLGISRRETDRMASAFEYEATDAARAFASRGIQLSPWRCCLAALPSTPVMTP